MSYKTTPIMIYYAYTCFIKVKEEVQDDENGIKTGKYVPPRVHAMPYGKTNML